MLARRETAARAPARLPSTAFAAPVFNEAEGLGLQGGRPLSADLRMEMQHRLGRDFSGVRVHTDAQGARAAEAAGARAVALGRDIAFGPGAYAPHQAAGRGLIAHELVHVAQQHDAGISTPALDPKPGAGGIGSKPPSEPFITMDTQGTEDAHALFGADSATLAADAARAVQAAVGQPDGPMVIHVHGYASSEGDADYNMNLSAHRAAAIQRAVESRLPEGSKIVLFAHGGSKDFGDRAANRRGSVSLIGPPQASGLRLHLSLAERLELKLGVKPPLPPPAVITDPFPPPPGPPGPAANHFGPLPDIRTPREKMDLAAVGAPLAGHGLAPGSFGDVVTQWDQIYLKYRFQWGLDEDWAARAANSELSATVQSQAQRDAPNTLDRSNADWKAQHPEEFATPIFKVDLFNLFSKKQKRKE